MGKNIRDISNQTIAGLLVVTILAVLGFVKRKWTEVAIAWLWGSFTATLSFELPVWGLLLTLLVVTMLVAGLIQMAETKAFGQAFRRSTRKLRADRDTQATRGHRR